jgi:putative chitinase
MTDTSFGAVLTRLWPNGDEKIPGLRAGMIETAGNVFQRYGISSPLLIAHVMAQISHECGAGHEVVEDLNYRAERIPEVWPTRFPSIASAAPYAHNPRALANKVYNGRMGNAPGSDDGFNFRGRGASQTTGREGYARLSKATGLDLVNHPDLVNDPTRFLECGVADFILCGCLPFAKADDILNVTKHLNGGTVGLAQRQAWLAKWKAALGTGPVMGTPRAPTVILPTSPVPPPPDVPRRDPVPQVTPAPAQSAFAKFIAAMIAAFRRN